MWPKTGCDTTGQNCFFGQSDPPCPSGGCQPPAETKIEFTFNNAGADYDISLVDGYSLPVSTVPTQLGGSCVATECNIDINACPTNEIDGLGDLRVFRNGRVVACFSPCLKWNYPTYGGLGKNEHTSPGVNMCCLPPISSPQCNAGPVVQTQYVNLVRSKCPTAYSFSYDDIAGNHQCPGSTSFHVTFCPSGGGTSTPPCTQWGWRFYDYHDIEGNDIANAWAADRNDCQPMCRNMIFCKAYSYASWNKICYFKSGASIFPANGQVYSAVIC